MCCRAVACPTFHMASTAYGSDDDWCTFATGPQRSGYRELPVPVPLAPFSPLQRPQRRRTADQRSFLATLCLCMEHILRVVQSSVEPLPAETLLPRHNFTRALARRVILLLRRACGPRCLPYLLKACMHPQSSRKAVIARLSICDSRTLHD